MQTNRFRSLSAVALIVTTFILLFTQGLFTGQVAYAQIGSCLKVVCTDTPTYPPKVTDTIPPQVTDTSTYPPKVTDTTAPQQASDTPVPPSATHKPKVVYPSPTATYSQTATLKPTVLGQTGTPFPSPTSSQSATPKATVLGQTGTPLPIATATFPLLIPIFQPTATQAPLSILNLPVPGDIWVNGIEITQATQIYGTGGPLDNSIPLVAGKKTVVRVYVQSDNYSPRWGRVTARLTVSGGREPGRIMEPITENSSGTIQVSPSGSDRGSPWDSFTFILDSDQTSSGGRHLAVDIFSITPRPELNTANNHREMDIHFVDMPAISLLGVVYGNDGTDPLTPSLAALPWSDFYRQWSIAENMAPVATFSINYFPGLGTRAMMFPNLDAARSWADRMLAQPGFGNARIYLLQPEQSCGCGQALGRRMNGQDLRSDAGHTMAQEVAHSMGMWWHAVSPEYPADMANPAFPYPHSQIGSQVGEMTFPGISPPVLPVKPDGGYGFPYHDFMGYAPGTTWVSPFTYCTYITTLTAGRVNCPPGADHASLAAPDNPDVPANVVHHLSELGGGSYLYVAGTLLPDGTASFEPFEQFASQDDITNIPAGNEYHLLFQDQDGRPLKDIPFTPLETHHTEPNSKTTFSLTVPDPAGTVKILLVRDGRTLAERDASPHAPKVDFSFDGGGQTLTGTRHFTWTASDKDNDPLLYSIEYSRDGGQTWLALDVNLSQPGTDINFDNLPGTDQGLLRIKASDGFNSSFSTSTGSFKVARKAPIITSVSPDITTYQGQAVYVEVTAFDWEDGPLTDPASILWNSDQDGALTSGRWIAPANLSVGDRTLTVLVRDSDGMTTTAQVHVKVLPSERVSLPKVVSLWQMLFLFGLPVLLLILILAGIYRFKQHKDASEVSQPAEAINPGDKTE